MQNHNNIIVSYNPADIFNVLTKYDPPVDKWGEASACSATERRAISDILNLGLPITSILYFKMGRDFTGLIHKDINLNTPNLKVNPALNLPLFNCEQVFMKWFTQNDQNINEKPYGGPSTGAPTPLLNYNNATCIDNVNCNNPTLVNITDWHSIENHSTEHLAFLISIRFASYVRPSMDLPMNEWLPNVGSNHGPTD